MSLLLNHAPLRGRSCRCKTILQKAICGSQVPKHHPSLCLATLCCYSVRSPLTVLPPRALYVRFVPHQQMTGGRRFKAAQQCKQRVLTAPPNPRSSRLYRRLH